MNFLKKNQLVIYVIALMLVVAGYFNYTSNEEIINTSIADANTTTKVGDIGDAALVSSNDVVTNTNSSLLNTTNTTNTTTNTSTNNTTTNSNTVETNANTTNQSNLEDYFVKSKLERDTMYSQMLETYTQVLNSTNALDTQKQSANEEITKINNTKNGIMICENLLSTKGFENTVIFANGDSVNVIVKGNDLDKDQIAQIQNIVSRELGADISNIHIATK